MTFLPVRGIVQLSFDNAARNLAQRRQHGRGDRFDGTSPQVFEPGQCQLSELLIVGSPSGRAGQNIECNSDRDGLGGPAGEEQP